jgi:cytochrome P450
LRPRLDTPVKPQIKRQNYRWDTDTMSGVLVSWQDFREATKALREFEQYLAAHIERLRHDDAANSILSDVIRDGDLTDLEIRMLAGLLLGAGFVTTTHVFGKAVVALVRHPDQLAELCAHPEGWSNAIEEILRYDTTGQLLGRVATEHVDIQGYPVRAGEAILLLLGGANRDPAVFERPDIFDITRTNAREHLSFGSGVHACLGAALARMELHIGLQSLFEPGHGLGFVGGDTMFDMG